VIDHCHPALQQAATRLREYVNHIVIVCRVPQLSTATNLRLAFVPVAAVSIQALFGND
jgi:hypothetical protein